MTHRIGYGSLLLAGVLGLALVPARAEAQVRLPPVFSSHMVLQRDQPVPVWGLASPGERVTVRFRNQEKTAVAGRDGRWAVRLDALQAGGPDVLLVRGRTALKLDDVLVGEVWVGSGQSNMAGPVRSYLQEDPELARLADRGPYPKLRLLKYRDPWQEATPANIHAYSALLFAFGLRLQKELDVPVGLMLAAVGSTPSGDWLSRQAYEADPACREAVRRSAAVYNPAAESKKHEQELARWEKQAEVARLAGREPPPKPDGLRKPGESVYPIGRMYEAHIRHFVGYGIRGVFWDQEGSTGISGVDTYTLTGALIRGWRRDWGQGDFPFLYDQKPNGGGCAWSPDDPVHRAALKFAPLPKVVPGDAAGGPTREMHIRITGYPQTVMSTTSDLATGLHAPNKLGYGTRAARVAAGAVYGRPVAPYGPTYAAHTVEGNKVRITFKNVGQGLAVRHGDQLQGFAVAGDDRAFHWADAVIDGEAVVVSSDRVPRPAAVRYGWALVMNWANLFNKDGMPALTFRTDDWAIVESK